MLTEKKRVLNEAERQVMVSRKIRLLRREGKSQKAAVGMAMGMMKSGKM